MADANGGGSGNAKPKREPKPKPKPRFTEEELRIDPDEWIVPAQDAKGHSVRVLVRIPPGMEGDMEILMQSGRLAYKTQADLIRHALWRHLHLLHEIEKDLPQHYLVGVRNVQALLAKDRYKGDTEETFTQLESQLVAYLNSGDLGEAVRLIAYIKAGVAKMEDSAWKRRFLERFRKEYGHYLQPGSDPILLPSASSAHQPEPAEPIETDTQTEGEDD